MHDPLVSSAVDDHGGRRGTAGGEVVFSSAQIAGALLTRGRDEVDGPVEGRAIASQLLGDGEHDRQPPTVVGDARPHHAVSLVPDVQLSRARKHRVEMGADRDRRAGGATGAAASVAMATACSTRPTATSARATAANAFGSLIERAVAIATE